MTEKELARLGARVLGMRESGMAGEVITHILLFRIIELLEDLTTRRRDPPHGGDRYARKGLSTKTS